MLWCWLALGKAKPKSSTLKKKILLQSPVCTEHVSADGVSHRAPLRVLTSQSVHMGAYWNILKYVKSKHLMFELHFKTLDSDLEQLKVAEVMVSQQHRPQVAPAPVVDNPRLLRCPGAELGPGAGHHHQSGQYPHHDVCLRHLVDRV